MIFINYKINSEDFNSIKRECFFNKWIFVKTITRQLWLKIIIVSIASVNFYSMFESWYFDKIWFNHAYHILFVILCSIIIFCLIQLYFCLGLIHVLGYMDGTTSLHNVGNKIEINEDGIKINDTNGNIKQYLWNEVKDSNLSYQNIVFQLNNGMFVFIPRRVFGSYHLMKDNFNKLKSL